MSLDIHERGFLHLKNIFTIKSLDLVSKYINSIRYDDKIKYFDKANGKQSYETLKDHLCGENYLVHNSSRDVVQIYLENALINNDQSQKIYDEYDVENISELFSKSYKIIANLIEYSNELYRILNSYCLTTIKVFNNKPKCNTQEIHCDDPNDNAIILLVPLVDCDILMGTTILYDDKFVKKYFKKDQYKLGYLEELNDNMREDFLKGKYEEIFSKGDAILFKSTTFHSGSHNMSKDTRKFLHIVFEKK